MKQYRMTVLEEPVDPKREIFHYTGEGPGMKGQGDRDYLCGKCGRTLLRKINPLQILGPAFKCNTCGSVNEIPQSHNTN